MKIESFVSLFAVASLLDPSESLTPNVCSNGGGVEKPTAASRRDLFRAGGIALIAAASTTQAAVLLTDAPPALAAAASTPSAQELERLQKGHARVQYLLNNWDDVTKVCGRTISKF